MRVAAIIYDSQTNEILIGKESFYCFERTDIKMIDRLEQCSELEAIQYAALLSELYHIEIRYSEFEHGKTHFVCQTSNSHWGIVKGHGEENETPLEAVIRETYEEVGIIVPSARWRRVTLPHLHRPTHTFLLSVSPDERNAIEVHIEERKRRHCGELFDLAFRDIQRVPNPMNHITRHLRDWLHVHSLPSRIDSSSLAFSPLVDYVPNPIVYQYHMLYEPEFVWGKKRFSLIKPCVFPGMITKNEIGCS